MAADDFDELHDFSTEKCITMVCIYLHRDFDRT